MIKRILIVVILYLVSVTILLVITDDEQIDNLSNRTLHSSTSINTENKVEISLIFENSDSYNLSEEELNSYSIGKVRILETSKLSNTIEIYTLDIYRNLTENALVTLDGNRVLITSDLGPLSFYKSSTFLTFGQFDSHYFDRAPNRIYEVHIPVGTQYILD